MRRRTLWAAIGLVLLGVVALVVAFVVGSGGDDGAPAPAVSPVKVAIDVSTTGNGANSIGPTESCNSSPMREGDAIDIDVVVRAIPPYEPGPKTGAIAGADFNLLFDPAVLQVNRFYGFDGPTILTAEGDENTTGFVDYNFDDSNSNSDAPGVTGNVAVGMIDLSPVVEAGDGVLGRFTVEAVGEGASRLDLAVTFAGNDKPQIFGPDERNYGLEEIDATIYVGDSNCSGPTPTTYPRMPDSPTPSPQTQDPDASAPTVVRSTFGTVSDEGPDIPLVPIVIGIVVLLVIGVGIGFVYVRRPRV